MCTIISPTFPRTLKFASKSAASNMASHANINTSDKKSSLSSSAQPNTISTVATPEPEQQTSAQIQSLTQQIDGITLQPKVGISSAPLQEFKMFNQLAPELRHERLKMVASIPRIISLTYNRYLPSEGAVVPPVMLADCESYQVSTFSMPISKLTLFACSWIRWISWKTSWSI